MKRKILFFLFSWVTIPHILTYIFSKNKDVITKDIVRWYECAQIQEFRKSGGELVKLSWLLLRYKEFRNVFYLRVGKGNYWLYYLLPLTSLHIWTTSENVGAGLFIQHGYSTVIAAKEIGENCWVNQQVTIGYNVSQRYGTGNPTLRDNVSVRAGAKVCGNITIGSNSTIGLNAVVVKNVPEGSTVIPSPMMLITENGRRVYKKL